MAYVEPLLAQLTAFSWKEEVTYKTRPANIDRWLRVHQGDLSLPFPVRETEVVHAHGAGRGPNWINDYKKQTVEGSFSFEVITGEFFGAIFGAVSTGAGPPYTHTITLLDAMPGSFGIQVPFLQPNTANVIAEFLGCRVSAATFKVGEDSETLMCDVEFQGAVYQDGGTSEETVSTSVAAPHHFKQGVLSSTAMWGGAKARIHDVELKVNVNTKPNYVGGNEYYPYDILPGKLDFGEAKFTVGIEDDTEWDELIGAPGTEYDFSYVFTRGANDTITFSGNGALKQVPFAVDEHDIRADLVLVPRTMQVVVEDTILLYPYE
jgi:hypothetical protein